jgi:uncharacterized coiled-coil protein SlyX
MKTLEQFLSDYLGKSKGYPDGKYVGECLSIVKIYIKECFGINPPPSGTNSAYGYWTNFPNPLGEVFEKIENTDTLIPEKGWIVIWKPWETNKYGHIAIIKDGNLNNFNSYDQNWGTKNFVEINHTYDNVVGFLKPKSIINDMTDEQKRILDFLNGKSEGDVREAFGALAEKPSKDGQIATLSQKVLELDSITKKLQEQIDILTSEVKSNNEIILDWQQKFQTANEQVSNATEQLDTITEDRNKYRRLYENLLPNTIDKYSAIELISQGIKKLLVKNK